MSIHDFPPSIETTEYKVSGESYDAAYGRQRLGEQAMRQAVNPEGEGGAVIYLPTHDSLRFGMDQIRATTLTEIDQEIGRITSHMARIDEELRRLTERRDALEERADDPGVFGSTSHLPSQAQRMQEVSWLTQALQQVRRVLDGAYQDARAKRTAMIIELERLEEADFALLKAGH